METEFSLTQIEKHLRHYSELDVSRVLEECQEWSSATSLVVRTPTRLIENILHLVFKSSLFLACKLILGDFFRPLVYCVNLLNHYQVSGK